MFGAHGVTQFNLYEAGDRGVRLSTVSKSTRVGLRAMTKQFTTASYKPQ